jgi:hypothetical protein
MFRFDSAVFSMIIVMEHAEEAKTNVMMQWMNVWRTCAITLSVTMPNLGAD